MFEYEAKVLRIIDGDTLKLDLDLGFSVHVTQTVRLSGVNTPELVKYGSRGIEDKAAAYVMQCVPPGSICIAQISKQEKYGRWLARILFQPGAPGREGIMRDPRVLNDELVREGYAVNYSGGKRTG